MRERDFQRGFTRFLICRYVKRESSVIVRAYLNILQSVFGT
jgi:hypothetical protein